LTRNTPLSAIEARVLATLMEKARTVPDSYPLTLNSLVTGCNQKSSRDPVMEVSEGEAQEALDSLRLKTLSVQISSVRSTRWEHNFPRGIGVPDQSAVLLALLMLRGPRPLASCASTPSAGTALPTSPRSKPFSTNCANAARKRRPAGRAAAARPRCPRTALGTLLCGPVDVNALASTSSASTGGNASALQQRVDALETEVAQLRATVQMLCESLGVEPPAAE
jgi:uncharacterized protein YceH (UPF0502 family)